MQTQAPSLWKQAVNSGLLGGAIALLLGLVGMVAAFSERFIISGIFTMGQVLYIVPILLLTYSGIRKASSASSFQTLLFGLISGLSGSAVLAVLVLIGNLINLRAMFVNASPKLYGIMTFGQTFPLNILVLLATGLITGAVAVGIYLLPARLRYALLQAVIWVVTIGLLRDLIVTVSYQWGPLTAVVKRAFALSGLTLLGALFIFVLVGAVYYWRASRPNNG